MIASDLLQIFADGYSSLVSGDDVIIRVGAGSITLVDARDKPLHIVIGESGTEGGSSNSGNNGGSSSSSGDGGRGGNDSGNTSGGTSGNEGMNSDASGGRSAVGSRGRSSSTSTDTSGGTVRATSSRSGRKTAGAMNLGELMSVLTPATQQTTTNQHVYSGGNQVIGDYTSDEKIIFDDVYTGSFYDGAGNFFVGSSTGALVIQNVADKVIDLQDTAGNSFLKAYAATTAGVIDGRGLAGFEIINGSNDADAIFAGDGGSQLWGGADVASDTMIVGVQSSEALSATFMLADGSQYRYNHATRNWQSATN